MGKDKSHPLGVPNHGGGVALDTEGPANVTAADRQMARLVMPAIGNPPIAFALWDGEDIHAPPDAVGRVILHDRGALIAVVANPEFAVGDLYSTGRLTVEGDLVEVLDTAYRFLRAARKGSLRARLMSWINRPRPNSLARARENIWHHYDVGNDFYRLWLDPRMVYTCAYYATPDMSLEEAQVAKLEHVCRKLRLRQGETVVEAGCGWGALALHMAHHYGVRVRAYNISPAQLEFARERARSMGLESQVEFVEDDYRNITGRYDVFVSVGMLEHVGPENYRALGELLQGVLKPSGRGLIHTIGRNYPCPNNPWIERRIFPGSQPPSLGQMMEIFEDGDYSVLDVENLRLHYARTCRDWLERYRGVEDRVAEMYDDAFVRAWRLYLAGSVAGFTSGSLQLFQVLFAPGQNNQVPLTREHLYRS